MKVLANSVALLYECTARLESSFNTHTAQSCATREPEDSCVSYHALTNCEERKLLGKAHVYKGTGNMKGFFCFFNWWYTSRNLSADDSLALLCSAVRGEAHDHLSNSHVLANGGSYAEMKSDLIAPFGGQEAENLSKLTLLKQGVHTQLDEYITSFCKLRS